MAPVNRQTAYLILAAWLTSTAALAAEPWTARLQDGGTVTVDPETNRATVTRYGVKTPLWDGVHRLQNGETLTVRSGIARPNLDIVESRRPHPQLEQIERPGWQGQPIVGGVSPCQRLVTRVCGTGKGCQDAEGCRLAQQLLDMESQERQAAPDPNLTTYTSEQCRQADLDRTPFRSCTAVSEKSP